MATATLRQGELEVHQVVGGSTVVNTAYGMITVPNGHWIIYFPGQMELATALPPETFDNLFEALDGAPTPAPAPPSEPSEPPSTAPEATGPSQGDVERWVDAHYHRSYRAKHIAGLMANPARAQELLDKYPLETAATNEPPAPQEVIEEA